MSDNAQKSEAREAEVLKRLLSTPHKKQADMKLGRAKGGKVNQPKPSDSKDRS